MIKKNNRKTSENKSTSSISIKPIALSIGIAALMVGIWKLTQSESKTKNSTSEVIDLTSKETLALASKSVVPTQKSSVSESSATTSTTTTTEETMTKEELKEMLDIKILTLENKIEAGNASLDRQTSPEARKELAERIVAAQRMVAELKKIDPANRSTWSFLEQMNTKTDKDVVQKSTASADETIDQKRNTP